jgi:hypothetical protein
MFEHMTTAERVQAAKEKIRRVVDHLLYLLALHEKPVNGASPAIPGQ